MHHERLTHFLSQYAKHAIMVHDEDLLAAYASFNKQIAGANAEEDNQRMETNLRVNEPVPRVDFVPWVERPLPDLIPAHLVRASQCARCQQPWVRRSAGS